MVPIGVDLTALATSHDIIALGIRADEVRRQHHGSKTTFVRVSEVSASPEAPIVWANAAGEVRITGVPASRTEAIERVRQIASAMESSSWPALSGFSLADLEQLAVREGVTLRALLEDLKAAGLELVAEAPVDALNDPRRSIEEVNIAGLVLARLTIHRLSSPDPLPVLEGVAELQRSVGVIRAFAPLPRTINPAAPTTGFDDLKRVALARLTVDVPSIQVDWSHDGSKLAQVALTMGADDVDAVSPDEEALEADTGTTLGRRRAPLEEIRRNVRAAGLEPVERNGRFDLLAR
jgi:2-iminoacetate synthase ThiH